MCSQVPFSSNTLSFYMYRRLLFKEATLVLITTHWSSFQVELPKNEVGDAWSSTFHALLPVSTFKGFPVIVGVGVNSSLWALFSISGRHALATEESSGIDLKLSRYKRWAWSLSKSSSLPCKPLSVAWIQHVPHYLPSQKGFSGFYVGFLQLQNFDFQVLPLQGGMFECLFATYILLMAAEASKIPQLKQDFYRKTEFRVLINF